LTSISKKSLGETSRTLVEKEPTVIGFGERGGGITVSKREKDTVKLTVVACLGVSIDAIPDILAPIQGEHITGFTALYDDGGLVFDVEVHGDYTLEEAIAILQGDPRVNFAESQNVAFPYASVPSENGAEDATAPSDSSDTKEKSLNNNPTIGIAPAYRDTQYMSALLPGFNPEAIANGTPIETDEKGGYFQKASINRLTEKGVLVVAAAGNDGVSDLHYPAALNNVVCVGATDQNGERAGFSNYGASIDLVAPGATIITTHMNNGYTTTNGTSFSAPIVAGTAALIYKKYGNDITPAMVEAILKATAIAKNSSNVYYDGSGLINAAAAVSQVDYRRFNGADRYDTSVRFASYAFPSASTAILVSGEDGKYPDALVAAGLAGTYNAPILLTPAGSLPILTRNYLINAGVNKVIVVGGTSSVSDSVVAMVQALNKTVVRIAGTDRYETAIAVYNHVNNTNGVSWGNTSGYRRPEYPSTSASWKTPGIKKVAILALGTSFADALSASSLAAYARYPVFLTNGTTLAPSVQSALQYGGFDELLVIGGASAISPAVRQQAMNLVNPVDINGMNWYIPTEGTDRYDTCLLLVKYARLEGLPLSKVILARGMGATPDTGWQDAVPVNALAQWGIKRKSGDYGLPPLSYELLPIAA